MLDVEVTPQLANRVCALADRSRHKLAYRCRPWQPWNAVLQAAQAHAWARAPPHARVVIELIYERVLHRYKREQAMAELGDLGIDDCCTRVNRVVYIVDNGADGSDEVEEDEGPPESALALEDVRRVEVAELLAYRRFTCGGCEGKFGGISPIAHLRRRARQQGLPSGYKYLIC